VAGRTWAKQMPQQQTQQLRRFFAIKRRVFFPINKTWHFRKCCRALGSGFGSTSAGTVARAPPANHPPAWAPSERVVPLAAAAGAAAGAAATAAVPLLLLLLLLLLLTALQPGPVERVPLVRTAAHLSCWEHLPSHSNMFPLRRSARAFGECSGHSFLECAVFECRELSCQGVWKDPGCTNSCPPQLLAGRIC
jgi:hypothetical protein